MSRIIRKTNPKGSDTIVSDDGHTYVGDAFTLHFQEGQIPQYGVRNGAFEEEIIAVLIDRAEQQGNDELAAKLSDALDVLLPPPVVSEATPSIAEVPDAT